MERVRTAKALDNYQIDVTFEDGVRGVVDLSDRLFGPVFEPLRDGDFFGRLFVDEFGVICWPNGADLAPDALHEKLAGAASKAE